MNRRAEIPGELTGVRQFRDDNGQLWGGMWLDYPTDLAPPKVARLSVAVTVSAATLTEYMSVRVPSDLELVIVRVERTQQALEAIAAAALDSDVFRSLGAELYSVAVLPQENAVEVVLSTVSSDLIRSADERFGAGAVRLVEGGPPQADVCSRTLGIPPTSNCGPPWRGGLAIYPSDNQYGYCMSGFVARKWLPAYQEWAYAQWTAGHCGSHQWRQGSTSGTLIGTTTAVYFSSGYGADVQIIPISETNRSNYYLDTTTSCSSCYIFWVTAKEGHNTDEPGDPVCNHGAVSGTKCGVIEAIDVSFPYKGVALVHMRRASYSRAAGDSGGPVTLGASNAEGSHTHYQPVGGSNRAIFSQVWEMESRSGYSVYLGN